MNEWRTVPITAEMIDAAMRFYPCSRWSVDSDRQHVTWLLEAAIAAAPPSELAELEQHCIADWINDWFAMTADVDGYVDTRVLKRRGLNIVRIVELRGMLEHHPTDPLLVRVKK